MEKGVEFQLCKVLNGCSWGNININEGHINLTYNDKDWININSNKITNITNHNKNEIGLEFEDDDNLKSDMLTEIKFYVPNRVQKDKADSENNETDSQNKVDYNFKDSEHLKEELDKICNSSQNLGSAIASISDIQMVLPRGKVNIQFLQNILKLTGPSIDYKVPYNHIKKLYLLPKNDGNNIFILVSLSQPVRQGNSIYNNFVLQIVNTAECSVSINLSEEDSGLLKHPLENEINGLVYDVLNKLFKSIVGVPCIISGGFKSSYGAGCVKCNFKTNDGLLYPLVGSLIFLYKPTIVLSIKDIKEVEYEVIAKETSQRFFKMNIKTNIKIDKSDKTEQYEFTNIETKELNIFKNYFNEKKIKLINLDQEDSDDGENKYVPRKVRKAPEVNMDIELPSEESYKDDEEDDDDDFDEDDDSEESNKKKNKNKKIKKGIKMKKKGN